MSPSDSTRLLKNTLVSLAVVGAVIALFYLFLDEPLEYLARDFKHGPLYLRAKSLSLLAGHTVIFCLASVLLVAGAVPMALGRSTPLTGNLLRIGVTLCVAIALVESVKWVFGRCRPQLLFEDFEYGFTWFTGQYERNSFPSGHTTRIFALATALSLTWRRSVIPVFVLACLVGAARVFALDHYPSDVMAGAWLGAVAAIWVRYLWCMASPEKV